MKRIVVLFITILLISGCATISRNAYQNEFFSVELIDGFEPVSDTGILCFAPHGDPLLSSSISFYRTELNWYFDRFDQQDYQTALCELCGYETVDVVNMESCRINGYDARRIACKVSVEQGVHDLIIYVINAKETYIFTLLNRDSDTYIESFDTMMKSIRWKGNE